MSIEEIVRVWKADEELTENRGPENPAGDALSDQELEQVAGGIRCTCTDLTDVCTYYQTCIVTG